MKTAVVLSDSHGNRAIIEKLYGVFSECDYIIHLGDTSADGYQIKKLFPQKTYILNGNCDGVGVGRNELILEIEDCKIYACHGDKLGVKAGLDRLAYKARELNCNLALYGHTHKADETALGGVTCFNPGATTRYGQCTYLYLAINGGKAVGKIVPFD